MELKLEVWMNNIDYAKGDIEFCLPDSQSSQINKNWPNKDGYEYIFLGTTIIEIKNQSIIMQRDINGTKNLET